MELKRCPFCGSEDIKITEGARATMPGTAGGEFIVQPGVIDCWGCGVRVSWFVSDKEVLKGRWNMRAPESESAKRKDE